MNEQYGLINMFEEPVEMIGIDKIKKCCSPFGNTFSIITEEQIEELRNGKVIYICDDEYCNFIMLNKEKENASQEM